RRDRAEQADERLLDVLGQLVDDAVGADLDAFPLGELARLGGGPHVEADHHSFEATARLMSFSVIPPTPWWITFTRTSGCWIFCTSETTASTDPSTSPLTTRFRSCTSPA